MLVLTRKKDQTLVIGDNIEVTVLDIQGDQVRFGINAPKNVKIYRKEIYHEIQQENKNAAMRAFSNPMSLKDLINIDADKTSGGKTDGSVGVNMAGGENKKSGGSGKNIAVDDTTENGV